MGFGEEVEKDKLTLDSQGMFVGAQQKTGIILNALHNDCEVLKTFIRTAASNLSIGNGSRAVSP